MLQRPPPHRPTIPLHNHPAMPAAKQVDTDEIDSGSMIRSGSRGHIPGKINGRLREASARLRMTGKWGKRTLVYRSYAATVNTSDGSPRSAATHGWRRKLNNPPSASLWTVTASPVTVTRDPLFEVENPRSK